MASTANPSQEPFIRGYNPQTDFEACIQIFRETADSALKTEPTWTYASYVWCRAYLHLTPASCFVLDDGNGLAVGYIIGTSDTAQFAQRWASEYLPTIDEKDVPRPDPAAPAPTWDSDRAAFIRYQIYQNYVSMLHGSDLFTGLWDTWPAHLHIDIRDGWRGKGRGREMINTFFEQMRKEGAKGIHLGQAATNTGALVFYERMGFERFPKVLDNGVSGEMGTTGKTGEVVWVKKL